ncbi:Carboxylesterase protein [Dioscorea alata]|uniref:Carboxylesterase protein n=1 Tax=Dioscorea alata TaxID=55571 RepID=A0ACB7W214_DIOAL|nr:Carboxylesterase protein [Dioscorea alata]
MTETPGSSPSLPLKTRISISFLSNLIGSACRSDGTVNRFLFNLFDFRSSPNPRFSSGVRTADITVDTSRNLWFRLFVPSSPSGHRLPVIVFFHGGGFAFLSPSAFVYDAVCRRFARQLPAIILSINYRLSPEHRHPAPYIDGLDTLRFLDSSELDRFDPDAAEIADLSNVFLAGDSAGGNIAHHVTRLWATEQDSKPWARVRISGLVAIQPFLGSEDRTSAEKKLKGAPFVSTKRTDWLWKAFLPEGSDRDHPAANVFGPKYDAELGKGFPATMVVIGGWDPLQDLQRRYAEETRKRGKEVKLLEYADAIHAFYLFPELELSTEFIGEMKSFVETHTKKQEINSNI